MLKKFDYNGVQVRTTTDQNNEIWFAGIDVCNILGYADSHAAVKKLDDDERRLDRVTDGQGKQKETLTVNEFGLYSLILTSTKPEAKAFKRWVTHEILPVLRKAGTYSTDQAKQREVDLQQITLMLNHKKTQLRTKQSDLNDLKREIKELELQRDEIIVNFAQLKLPFETNQIQEG